MINPGLVYILGSLGLYFTKDKLREVIAALIPICTLILIYRLPLGGRVVVPFLDFELILLEVSEVSKVIAVVFVFFALASLIYSLSFFRIKDYLLSYIYIGSSIAILFVGDFFSFYICWEMMTISSYFLIFDNRKPITRQTSYYYFVMHLVGAVSLLWGILLHYNATGSMVLTKVEVGLPFFILAVGIKLAFIGLHTWLPKNYANTPFYISVILSAYTTKVGVYAFYRLLGGTYFLAYAGVVTALLGVLMALRQIKIRKLLSYHIISQIGYMIVALSVGTSLGVAGGILHLVNNVLYKGLLFMVAGIIIYTTGEEDLSKLGGLVKKLPLTFFYALLAALAIAGLPSLNGHISKLLIKKSSHDLILIWGLYIAGIGTSLSFIKVIYFAFLRNNDQIIIKKKPKKMMLVGMGLLSSLILIIGIKPNLLVELLGVKKELHYFSLKYILLGIIPTIIAIVLFKLAYNLIKPHLHQEIVDFYPRLEKMIDYPGKVLSNLHNGDLSRYVLWLLTTLIAVWINFLL